MYFVKSKNKNVITNLKLKKKFQKAMILYVTVQLMVRRVHPLRFKIGLICQGMPYSHHS